MNIFEALQIEESLWRLCFEHTEVVKGWTSYWSPSFPEMKHFNITYPQSPDAQLRAQDLVSLQTFYASKGILGSAIDLSNSVAGDRSQPDYYFYRPNVGRTVPSFGRKSNIEVISTNDLERFSHVAAAAFGMDSNLIDRLHALYGAVSKSLPSHFLIARLQGEDVGCVSSSLLADKFHYWMNGAVNAKFRNSGAMSAMVEALNKLSLGPVITRTQHPRLARAIFPRMGFLHLGESRPIILK